MPQDRRPNEQAALVSQGETHLGDSQSQAGHRQRWQDEPRLQRFYAVPPLMRTCARECKTHWGTTTSWFPGTTPRHWASWFSSAIRLLDRQSARDRGGELCYHSVRPAGTL